MAQHEEFDGIPDDDIWNIDFTDLEFEKEIAKGSFGKVYQGKYLGVPVAIKQIFRHKDPAYLKYIEREISVLKAIRHPFIVGFCGVCLHKSTGLYIVTEFIEGGDVRTLLKKRDMDWGTRVQIALDLAKAMYYLHSKKIIHRDLKSKNLLMGADKRIRLCDFGFARITDFSESKAMTICGTPGFVAPEIMMGKEYDEKCDTFSFGNVLAELITFRRPGKDFWVRSAQDGYQLKHSDLKGKVAFDCPRKFLELCLLCCEYNSKDRPSFEMIVKSLVLISKEVQGQEAKKNPPTSPSPTPNNPNNNNNNNNQSIPTAANQQSTLTVPDDKSGFEIADLSYVKTISQHKIQLTKNEVIVSDKHLGKMINKATTPDYSDPDYVNDLVLCYPCFSEPQKFLTAIIERYKDAMTGKAEDDPKRKSVVEIRVIILLKYWIQNFPEDFLENGMDQLASEFDKLCTQHITENKEPYSIQNALSKSITIKKERRASQAVSRNAQPGFDLHLSKYTSKDIANQICLIVDKEFISISAREYLKETWKYRTDSNIKKLVERTRFISNLVSYSVLQEPKPQGRKERFQKWVEIADICYQANNFAGVFAIFLGLRHESVTRLPEYPQSYKDLKDPWAKLYKSLLQLTDKSDHYLFYKNKQTRSSIPTVPHIEIYLEQFSYIENYNPDVGKGGVINFSKHRKLGHIIKDFRTYASQSYSFPLIQSLMDILEQPTSNLTADTLQKHSFNILKPSGF